MTPNQNVKNLIAAAQDTATVVVNALADHKIQFVETLGLIEPLTRISGVDFKAVAAEWKGADAESRADVIKFAHEKIEFGEDATEEKVEAVVDTIISIGGLFTHNVTA